MPERIAVKSFLDLAEHLSSASVPASFSSTQVAN